MIAPNNGAHNERGQATEVTLPAVASNTGQGAIGDVPKDTQRSLPDATGATPDDRSAQSRRQDDALNAAMRASRDRRVLAMAGGNPEALEEIRRFDVPAVGRRIVRLLNGAARLPSPAESQAYRAATTTALPVSHEAPSEAPSATEAHDPDTCWCNDDAFGLGPCRECRDVFQRTRARLADAVGDGR